MHTGLATSTTAARLALESRQLDAAAELAVSSVRRWEENNNRHAATLPGITLAQIHVQAGERDGLVMADEAIGNVAELRSARAHDRLLPLADALAARRDGRELAVVARRVASAT